MSTNTVTLCEYKERVKAAYVSGNEISLSFSATVKEIGPKIEYMKDNKPRQMQQILLCDSTAFTVANVHMPKLLLANSLTVDASYYFANCLVDANQNVVVINTKSTVFRCGRLTIDPKLYESYPTIKEAIVQNEKCNVRSIEEAIDSPRYAKMSVRGKIYKKGDITKREVRKEPTLITNMKIMDDTGKINVGFFRGLATTSSNLKVGSNILATKMIRGEFRGMPTMSSSDDTMIEILPPEEVEIDMAEISDSDDDSNGNLYEEAITVATVLGIANLSTYPACDNKTCSFKKVTQGLKSWKCICGRKYSAVTDAAMGIVAEALLRINNADHQFTLFKTSATKLLKTPCPQNYKIGLTEAIEEDMLSQLPLTVIGKASGTVFNVESVA